LLTTEVFVPLTQADAEGGLGIAVVIRGSGNPDALIAAARREIHGVDKDLALTDVTTLRDLVHDSVGDQRFRTSLLAGFAGCALFLAALVV
jgi:hypothetical protein